MWLGALAIAALGVACDRALDEQTASPVPDLDATTMTSIAATPTLDAPVLIDETPMTVPILEVDLAGPGSILLRSDTDLPPAFAFVGDDVAWLNGDGTSIVVFAPGGGERLIALPEGTRGYDLVTSEAGELVVADRWPGIGRLLFIDAESGIVLREIVSDVLRDRSIPVNGRLMEFEGNWFLDVGELQWLPLTDESAEAFAPPIELLSMAR